MEHFETIPLTQKSVHNYVQKRKDFLVYNHQTDDSFLAFIHKADGLSWLAHGLSGFCSSNGSILFNDRMDFASSVQQVCGFSGLTTPDG